MRPLSMRFMNAILAARVCTAAGLQDTHERSAACLLHGRMPRARVCARQSYQAQGSLMGVALGVLEAVAPHEISHGHPRRWAGPRHRECGPRSVHVVRCSADHTQHRKVEMNETFTQHCAGSRTACVPTDCKIVKGFSFLCKRIFC